MKTRLEEKMAIAVICCAVMLGMLQSPSLAEDATPYTIYRVGGEMEIDGRLDEVAWTAAPDVGKFQFPWYESGTQEQTVAKLLWDDEDLYVSFLCEDAHIWGEAIQRDGPVYRDDCVEVFAAPNQAQPETYFNIEMNVLGIFLDQYRPGGPGKKMEGEWNGEGIRIATSIAGSLNDDEDEDRYWVLEAAIPLKNYALAGGTIPPQPGDVWHLGLNRCGGKTNQQYSQWSPSQTERANFHRPVDFGPVTFSSAVSPFWRE
jgi:hypothetical protein